MEHHYTYYNEKYSNQGYSACYNSLFDNLFIHRTTSTLIMVFSMILVYTDTKEVLLWMQGSRQAIRSIVSDPEHLQKLIKTALEDNIPVKIASHQPNTEVKDVQHYSDVLNGESSAFQSCLRTPDRPAQVCSTGSCSVPDWAKIQDNSSLYHRVDGTM